jgi:hypothetical protein
MELGFRSDSEMAAAWNLCQAFSVMAVNIELLEQTFEISHGDFKHTTYCMWILFQIWLLKHDSAENLQSLYVTYLI